MCSICLAISFLSANGTLLGVGAYRLCRWSHPIRNPLVYRCCDVQCFFLQDTGLDCMFLGLSLQLGTSGSLFAHAGSTTSTEVASPSRFPYLTATDSSIRNNC